MYSHLEELEQIQAEVLRVITMLRSNEKELRARGFDVDASIAEIQDQFAQTVRTFVETDRAHDDYLHACADIADAETEYCKELIALMDPIAKEHPADPMIRKYKQLRPLIASEVPLHHN
jgi:hypothetical protein